MDYRQIAAELERLDQTAPVTLQLTASQAWALLSCLQLAFRHPDSTGPARQIAEQIARDIQRVVAPEGSALAVLAERGWQPPAARREQRPSLSDASRAGE
jgi:hypothetical protein